MPLAFNLADATTTGDAEGGNLEEKVVPELTEAVLQRMLLSLEGTQLQIAPKYSALKYQGKPLYYWARKGVAVPSKLREITLHQVRFTNYFPERHQLFF